MAEIRKIITKEEEEKRKEDERQKRQGRAEVEALPSEGYSHAQVEDIVSRMKQRYEGRGYGTTKGKGAELKEKVVGAKGISLDQRDPKELILAKGGFAKLVGRAYAMLPILNRVSNRIAGYRMAAGIPRTLDRANMNYSTRQFLAIAVFASLLVAVPTALVLIALSLTVFAGPIAALASSVASPESPLVGAIVAQGADPALVALAAEALIVLSSASLFGLTAFIVALLVSLQWPSNRANQRGKAIEKEMPFALRHMATEVKAGIGVYKTMQSIAEAGYGELSVEFERTIRDIEKGVSTEEALIMMSERSPSESLGRALMHVVRALKTGGNLSQIIETIASEVAFELRMKMRDFVERLNLIGLFYMMVGIVFPVFIAVLAGIFNSIPTIGLTGLLGTEVLFLVYFILIPMALGLILYVIKVMQPM